MYATLHSDTGPLKGISLTAKADAAAKAAKASGGVVGSPEISVTCTCTSA